MANYDLIFPETHKTLAPGDQFDWTIDDTKTSAEHANFYLLNNSKVWHLSGGNGSGVAGNRYSFTISIDYIDDNILEGLYTLNDKMQFSHGYSVPHPGGGAPGIAIVGADEATVFIRIDPLKGVAQGTFNARVQSRDGKTINPKGTFLLNLTRQP